MRWPQFTVDPPCGIGSKWVGCQHPGFGVTAFRAFESAMLEAFRPIRDRNRPHPRLTVRTSRTMDRQQLWIWSRDAGHGLKLNPAEIGCLYGRRQEPKIPLQNYR
jgi:hypothetical protein